MVHKLKVDLGFVDKRRLEHSSSESSFSPLRPPPKRTLSSPDDSLKSLLKDESDQEIVEILKSTRKLEQAKPRPPPDNCLLSASLNLTNLNVSFNSSNIQDAKRKLEASRTQALLVKSFAHDKNETSDAEEDQANESSRSSSIYQSDDKYEDDFIEEQVDSESASEVQEEDLPWTILTYCHLTILLF